MNTEATLTKREAQIAELLAWGAAKKEVADRLELSTRTIENTARNIYQKLEIQKATELSVWYFCTKYSISFDISPLKKTIIAVFFMFTLIPYELAGNDILRTFRSRRATRIEVRTPRRRDDETTTTKPIIV